MGNQTNINTDGGPLNIIASAIGSNDTTITYTQQPKLVAGETSQIVSNGISQEMANKLIDIHRKYLEQLYLQQASLGLQCPPHVAMEIDDRQKAIELLVSALEKR